MAAVGVSGTKRKRADEAGAASTPSVHTVYAEGMPYTATEAEIRKFFDGCGTILSLRAPRYHDSGRLRGYAHVDFSTAAAAAAAIARDGAYMGGRFISVAAAKEAGSTVAAVESRPRPAGCTTLFVKGLPYETDEEAVKAAFARFGNVVSTRLARWNHTDRLKGFGYVQFEHGFSAESAMKAFHAGAGEAATAAPFKVGGRAVEMDYDTAAPKQSFKTATGQHFYKTDEGSLVTAPTKTHLAPAAEGEEEGSAAAAGTKEKKSKKKERREAPVEEEEEVRVVAKVRRSSKHEAAVAEKEEEESKPRVHKRKRREEAEAE